MWGGVPDLYLGMIIGAIIVVIAFLIILLLLAYKDMKDR